jgi:leucyl aminopeptidase (aminopeptidase T)
MHLNQATDELIKKILRISTSEKVLLVTDHKNPIIASLQKKIAAELVKIPFNRNHSEPLPALKEKFSQVDVIIAVTNKSISHCPETRAALAKGTRIVSMPGIDKQLFIKAMLANQTEIKRTARKLLKKLKAETIHITSRNSTDCIFQTTQHLHTDDGDTRKPGTLNNIPYGEVFFAPIYLADGLLVVSSRFGKNICLRLENGRIVSSSSKRFVTHLLKAGSCALEIVELGFGINPLHKKPTGKIIHDEKIYGSVHIAFGGFGNLRRCPIHEDVIILEPTVYADSKKIIDKGKII